MSDSLGLQQRDVGEGQVAGTLPPWPTAATPVPRRIDEHLVALVSPSSFEAEPYRILLSVLEKVRAGRPSLAIAVTSAAPNDGKTTTSINLAAMLARPRGARVLLLDADLRRPSVAKRIGLADKSDPDLERVLASPELVGSESLMPCFPLPLSVVTAGTGDGLPLETLHTPAFGALVQAARQAYRYVVVDTPPVVALPDARAVSNLVDGFVVVVRAGVTPRSLLAEALEALEPEKVMGLVFNGDQRPFGGYYGRYQSYYQAQRKLPRSFA
jgi:capsular exopolysaccharide synthesis family protein